MLFATKAPHRARVPRGQRATMTLNQGPATN